MWLLVALLAALLAGVALAEAAAYFDGEDTLLGRLIKQP